MIILKKTFDVILFKYNENRIPLSINKNYKNCGSKPFVSHSTSTMGINGNFPNLGGPGFGIEA
jgi:hypothetical protein